MANRTGKRVDMSADYLGDSRIGERLASSTAVTYASIPKMSTISTAPPRWRQSKSQDTQRGHRTSFVKLTVSDAELEAMRRVADLAELPLAVWIRRVLMSIAGY